MILFVGVKEVGTVLVAIVRVCEKLVFHEGEPIEKYLRSRFKSAFEFLDDLEGLLDEEALDLHWWRLSRRVRHRCWRARFQDNLKRHTGQEWDWVIRLLGLDVY